MIPLFSVIVPVHRQWHLIPALLEALRGQTLPPDRFEILLVNNEDTAPPALPDAASGTGPRVIPCPTPGSYAARNAGAAVARGDWLAFTDADCRPDPGWLAALAAALSETPLLLAGPIRMIEPAAPNPFEIYDLFRGIPQAAYVARGYAATANLALPRSLFHRLDGFDARRFSGGDAEFCRRAGARGYKLTLVPAATVAHPCRSSWAEIATKARRTKGGQVAAGPLPRRLAWTLRTLMPPLRDSLAYLRADRPWQRRRVAVAIRWRVWGVELAETVRLLLLARRPERR